MPRLLLVGTATPTNHSLIGAFRKLGADADLVEPDAISSSYRRTDIHLGRLNVLSSLAGIECGLETLRELELDGACVLNRAGSLVRCHDKLATARELERAGLPHPRTTVIADRRSAPGDVEPPFVVKPRFGSWGRDVYLCPTADDLGQTLTELSDRGWFRECGALLQELEPTGGQDIRVIVADGRVIGALRRISSPGDWQTSAVAGGRYPVVLSREAVSIAVRAAAAVEGDLVGVDIIAVRNRHTVIDVNGCVDFTTQYSSGADVFETVAAALLDAADRWQAANHQRSTNGRTAN